MPIRVLHILGSLNRGGVETWLMHILRAVDHDRVKMDFLVHTEHPGAYDEEAKQLGAKILICPRHSRPFTYRRNLLHLIRTHGPYDVIHSHVGHFSGYILRTLSLRGQCQRRIAHSHTSASTFDCSVSWTRSIYLALMKRWIRNHATDGLGCSGSAMSWLFGPNWTSCPNRSILHCGIALQPFMQRESRQSVAAEFKIPEDRIIIGHVGGFRTVKNHSLTVAMFAALCQHLPQAVLLLVGDGPEKRNIEQQVIALTLQDKVVFAGTRSDVARLMTSLIDVFVFPSLYEGLPMVLIEAQAAGLPCVISDVIPTEVDVVPSLLHRVPLNGTLDDWVFEVLKATQAPRRHQEGLYAIEGSAFNISRSLDKLYSVYETSICGQRSEDSK